MTSLFFQHIAQRIQAAKAAADVLSKGTSHKGIAGQIREIAIKECIRPFLTQSHYCGSGVVIDMYGSRSDQIDAVIYDRRIISGIDIGDGVAYHPVESVKYVFEIKTKLTATEIKDAMKKFQSMRRLRSFPVEDASGLVIKSSTLPAAVLFAFDSDIKGSEIKRFEKYNSDEPLPISALCVIGKGYWVYNSADSKWYGHARKPGDPLFLEFCQLMTGMMNTLAAKELTFTPFSPGRYLGNYPEVD